MIKMVLSLALSLLFYIVYHLFTLANYIDIVLISIIIYFDFTDDDLFFFIIPLSLLSDYMLDIYFGFSAILFFIIYLFRVLMSKNMFFKSQFLKFVYYFSSVLFYNIVVSKILGIGVETMVVAIPIRLFLDIAIIYIVNTFLESKFVVSYGK
ncbi:hypothetical protein Calni_0364 [Calditerrivibrio nitroreducens DSM 19672]|uniref:Rod shape-determining protein MreD n=1 Tax=Calditerrivibrio nitroreducens (strain DSM 19672 / NBRC 101217 / Yu37-1) TaxID=768670 RepID=E4TEF1_CALNY|nr:hypothetical protein Calni_0364 [Calditerrivibrio nitroreducens DSM 19672]